MALDKIRTELIADDAVTAAKIPTGAIGTTEIAEGALSVHALQNTTSHTLSGTYTDSKMYTSDAYVLGGDITVNSNLVLSTVKGDGSDITLTDDGTARTITGTGKLEGGSLVASVPNPTNTLTEMTGELGSVVTGSPNLNLTNFTGTIGSGVSLNHDAQKYAWHRYITANIDVSSNATLDFTHSTYLGSGLMEAGGVITLDSSGGGLYLVSFSCHNHTNTANDHTWNIRVDGTNITGGTIYANYNSAGSVLYYGPVGTISIPVLLNNSATVEIYGNGYVNGDETTTWFCGVRIGAKT